MFYFGFLVWALPTNLLLQRLPVGKYLGSQIFMWGFFLMLQAACKSFTTLAVLRALGGAAEACSDPACKRYTQLEECVLLTFASHDHNSDVVYSKTAAA
jgi:hypothetical protein